MRILTLLVTVHDNGQKQTRAIDVDSPVAAAEALLKANVTDMGGRGLSINGEPVTARTVIEQPGTELEVHPYSVFG